MSFGFEALQWTEGDAWTISPHLRDSAIVGGVWYDDDECLVQVVPFDCWCPEYVIEYANHKTYFFLRNDRGD